MSEAITGVVVLQRLPNDSTAPYRLWFQYTRADGIIGYSTIPMIEHGMEPNLNHKGPLWTFRRENPWLHCSPSVRILGPRDGAPDHFHNAGNWSNHYVEMAYPWGTEPDAHDVCRAINEHTTKEDRDRVILHYRAEQVLA